MREEIFQIFHRNIELLSQVDKAVAYIREEELAKALELLSRATESIELTIHAVIENREYFNLVSTESVEEMLEGILEAKKNRDYVLLADLLEVQLANLLCSVQELIMKQEDYFAFNEEAYFDGLDSLDRRFSESLISVCGYGAEDDEKERLRVNHSALLREPLDPAGLLENGYAVELTSCGLMTVALKAYDDSRIYLHTNGHVKLEAFSLAKKWFCEGVSTYIVYGLGMGYHVEELALLAPNAEIIVFESDMNIYRLFCAFAESDALLDNPNVKFVYDPDFIFLDRKLAEFTGKEKFCIHYPSFRKIRDEKARDLLSLYIPWYKTIAEC